MTDVFVSYASEDRQKVQPLVRLLEDAGITVWWDRHIGLGTSFDVEIERALDQSRCVIVVWSRHSVESEWVRSEAADAADRGIVVPVLIDEAKPPLSYRRMQSADLRGWGGDRSAPQISALLDKVVEILGRPPISDAPKASSRDAGSAPRSRSEDQSRPSIAVMPFSNLSRDVEYEYLADGMTDDVITLLAADPNMKVTERNSVYSYKGHYESAQRVAEELSVSYLIEGSVRAAGDKVRVTVQLVDAWSGKQLWGQRYDRPFTEIVDVQDDIVGAIVTTLGGELYRAESERARRRSPDSLNDWGLIVRAATELGKLGSAGFQEVVGLCRRAIEVNDDAPLAVAILANALAMRSAFAPTDTDRAEALGCAEAAMAQANDDPLVLTYAANALTWLGRGQRALGIVRRAIDLAPNIATSYGTLAYACLTTDQPAEAIRNADRAISMSPRDLSLGRWCTTKAFAHSQLAEWEAALDAAQTATDRMPEFASAWRVMSVSLAQLGQVEAAVEAAGRATELAPESWTDWTLLAEVLSLVQRFDEAIYAANTAVDLRPEAWQPLLVLSGALRANGQLVEADAMFGRARSINPNLSDERVGEFPIVPMISARR